MSARSSKLLSFGSLAVIASVAITGLVGAFQAEAGPITGGAGNAPFTKLAVYQGLLTIVPTGGTDLLEIGNAGRDFAGTSDIYFRPGSASTGTADYFRFYKNTSNRVSADIPGSLLLGPTGSGAAGTSTANGALILSRQWIAGNNCASAIYDYNDGSNERLAFGVSGGAADPSDVVGSPPKVIINALGNVGINQSAPSAKLAVNNPNAAKVGNSGTAIYGYANGATGAAIEAEQAGSAWAGYFTGKVYFSTNIGIGGSNNPGSSVTLAAGDVYVASATNGIILKNGTTCARATLNATFNGFTFTTLVSCPTT